MTDAPSGSGGGSAGGSPIDGGLAYELVRPVNPWASVVLARNPGAMTLEGTNTWLLRAPNATETIVVDPGPDDVDHLAAVLAAAGQVATILLTHGHLDHSEGAKRLHELSGADVRCLDPHLRFGSAGLGEGDVVSAAGLELRVWATPGHSSDSLSFLLDDGGPTQAVLTGDTILGRGTTVVAHPDGVLADYLTSLRRLAGLPGVSVLPGHGPELADAGAAAHAYLAHREGRLAQVRAALDVLGPDTDAKDVVARVYADVDQALWPAAEFSVLAQLAYLRTEQK